MFGLRGSAESNVECFVGDSSTGARPGDVQVGDVLMSRSRSCGGVGGSSFSPVSALGRAESGAGSRRSLGCISAF